MLGTFIDTLVICTMTALVIITTQAQQLTDAAGATQRSGSFHRSIQLGLEGSGVVVTIGLVVFAFTTVLGWSCYGERCTTYLFGESAALPFRLTWVAVVVIGAVAGDRGVIWAVADTLNGLIAPTLWPFCCFPEPFIN